METVTQEAGNDTDSYHRMETSARSRHMRHYRNMLLFQIQQSKKDLDYLHTAAKSIGTEKLGFHPVEIGCKSIRSGAAMSWHLAGHRA